MFHLDTLTLTKSPLSKIPLPQLVNQNIHEFLTGNLVADSGLEAHQYISDNKSITVVLKYYIIYSKGYQYINTIENIFTKQFYLIWEKNILDEYFWSINMRWIKINMSNKHLQATQN